jgi:dienelactone hydrolase
VALEQVASSARGTTVDLFTAVPEGHADGAGLPVVVVLHGASGRPSDYQRFGLPRFLTQAVQDGAAPFVLAGLDGGPDGWEGAPLEMVTGELPGWLDDRGFDASRVAVWGWSRGGFGALRLAQTSSGWARAVAAFSPAISTGDAVFRAVDDLAGTPLGVCCGEQDSFHPTVAALVEALPEEPEWLHFGPGGHTRAYWNSLTPSAFAWLAGELA